MRVVVEKMETTTCGREFGGIGGRVRRKANKGPVLSALGEVCRGVDCIVDGDQVVGLEEQSVEYVGYFVAVEVVFGCFVGLEAARAKVVVEADGAHC